MAKDGVLITCCQACGAYTTGARGRALKNRCDPGKKVQDWKAFLKKFLAGEWPTTYLRRQWKGGLDVPAVFGRAFCLRADSEGWAAVVEVPILAAADLEAASACQPVAGLAARRQRAGRGCAPVPAAPQPDELSD
eukprot:851064-Lingulodinium_polyedra.AAC.1